MKLWYGSRCGSETADPYLLLKDPDSDPDPDPDPGDPVTAIFVSDLPDVNKKENFS